MNRGYNTRTAVGARGYSGVATYNTRTALTERGYSGNGDGPRQGMSGQGAAWRHPFFDRA